MDLKDLAKRAVKFLFSNTLAMALMFIVAGYSIHAVFVSTTLVGALLNAGIALLCLLLGRTDMRRRDRQREALLVQRLVEESECQDGECCQDGHCEVEETECQEEDCCSTEAKPEKKVC